MNKLLRLLGIAAFWCAWPVFWVYFKRSYGRTRMVLTNAAGEVLVMKQWISSGKWHLPGGGLHAGEDPLLGGLRELHEETGIILTSANLTPHGKHTWHIRGFTYDMYIYAARVGNVQLKRQRIEVAEITWVKPEVLTPANTETDVLHCLRVAGAGK